MFGKIKIRCAVAALIAVMVTLLSRGSLAFYSALGTATNVVTSGNIQLLIHETTDQGKEFPEEGVFVVPGDIVSKKVTVESDCDHPFYLRVKILYGIQNETLSAKECFKLNIDEENWLLHDGWYYYKGIVQPGETTPHIFSHVEMVGAKIDKSYIGKTLTLTVEAQAVQSENNPLTDGNYYTAQGWPEEGGV